MTPPPHEGGGALQGEGDYKGGGGCCGMLQNPHVQLQRPGAVACHGCTCLHVNVGSIMGVGVGVGVGVDRDKCGAGLLLLGWVWARVGPGLVRLPGAAGGTGAANAPRQTWDRRVPTTSCRTRTHSSRSCRLLGFISHKHP